VFLSSLIGSGKVIKSSFRGDERKVAAAALDLESSIDAYNNALLGIHLRIGVKVYELLDGTYLIYTFAIPIANQERFRWFENSKQRTSATIGGQIYRSISTKSFVHRTQKIS
jgi:hypothetical protein